MLLAVPSSSSTSRCRLDRITQHVALSPFHPHTNNTLHFTNITMSDSTHATHSNSTPSSAASASSQVAPSFTSSSSSTFLSSSPTSSTSSPPSSPSSSSSSSSYPIDADGLQLRPVSSDDYERGFISLLGQLTDAGTVTKDMFVQRLNHMSRGEYHIWVIEDTKLSKIIATTTLLIERKFIHSCGTIGHIEDVVVNKEYRGKNLGFRIVEQLCKIGKEIGCYKIILDCEPHNVAFYNRLGFKEKGRYMGLYF